MSTPAKVRKAIKAAFPNLAFRVRKVGFSDLARGEAYFVESPEWGMTKGNQDTFQKVKEVCKEFPGVIVSW